MSGIAAPFDRKAIENAIAAWLKRAVDIPFLWTNQNAKQPALPYMTGQLRGPISLGQDQTVINGQPANPQSGAEVAIEVSGLRKFSLSLNAYAVANGDLVIEDARQHMDKARVALSLPSFVDAFVAAGIAIIQDEEIQNLDFVNSDTFVSRAQMDVSFCVASNAEERIGYIETAEVTAPDLGWNPEIFKVAQ